MKRTPSSARRIARSVLIAVWPTYWPTSEARSTSTRWPFSRRPIAPYISASSRATVVLPVPGLPRKTRCWLVATSGRPCSFRRACTWRNASSACTCSLTVSRPTRPSSSACSSGSGRGGVARGPRPSSSSSSGPAVRLSWSPSWRAAPRRFSIGFGGTSRVYPRSAFFERPLERGHLLLQQRDALLERGRYRNDGLDAYRRLRSRRRRSPPPRSWPQRSWLWPGRRGSFSASSAADSASSACSTSSSDGYG